MLLLYSERKNETHAGPRSLAQLYDQYSSEDLAVIAGFLSRNAERLRAETSKLTAQPPR